MRTKGLSGVLALGLAAVAVVGCGSSSDSSSTSTASSGGAATTASANTDCTSSYTGECEYTDEQKAAAAKLGEEAAGTPVKLPAKTVGYVNFANGVEAADRVSAATKAAVEAIGWKFIQCDGKGDPTQQSRCGSTLLSQGANVLIVNSVDAGTMAAPLKQAKSKSIPAIVMFGAVPPSPLYGAQFAPDEALAGKSAADYLVDKLENTPGANKSIAIQNFPAPFCTERVDQLKNAVKGTDIKVAAEFEADGTNLTEGTRKQTLDILTQHPDLGGIFYCFDAAGAAGAQAVAQKYPGKKFPDRPLVVTFHAEKSTQDLIRAGQIDMVADTNEDGTAFLGVDQLAQLIARGTAMSKEMQPKQPVEYLEYDPVTADDLPPKGQFHAPKDAYPAFYEAKWKKEFGSGN